MNDTNDRGNGESMADPHVVRHEWEPPFEPTVAIVEAVAAATGRTPTDLPPLQSCVDPDAIDALISDGENSTVRVSFRYAETVVVVEGNGAIEVRVTTTE